MPEAATSDAELSFLLRSIAGIAHRALSGSLLAHGVTASEWSLLRELHAEGAVPQTRIAARLHMTAGAISRLVDRLVAKRLLVRGRGGGGDRRVQIIGLTGTGALLVPTLARVAAEAEAAMFAALISRERTGLEVALRKLAGHVTER